MAYATMLKCVDLHREADNLKAIGLAQYFPDISTQWDDISKVLKLAISSKIAWTGQSMTKSDNVPDDTRIPPNVEINQATIRIMKQKADDLSITLSSSHEFFDEDDGFIKAAETWAGAGKLFLDIISLAQELTMFKYMLAEFHNSNVSTERSPGQLIPFMNCDVPLAQGLIWAEKLNWEGIEAAFGDFYWDVMSQIAMETLSMTPIELEAQRFEQNVDKEDDPDNPGVKTIYPFSITGYSLIGVVKALDSGGAYHQSGITYTSSTAGKLTLNMPVGDAPDTFDFELHGLKVV